MHRLLSMISFLMFFPVGCSLINDFSADILERVRRVSVTKSDVPALFPIVIVQANAKDAPVSQDNEASTKITTSPEQEASPTNTLPTVTMTPTTEAHSPVAMLTHYGAIDEMPNYSFTFPRDLLDDIRRDIHIAIREAHEKNLKAAPIGVEMSQMPPWRLNSLQVLEAFDNGHMRLKVSAVDAEGSVHIGWYEATNKQLQPMHYLKRENISPKLLTLPVSIGLTCILWFWHRKRRQRMIQWQQNHALKLQNTQTQSPLPLAPTTQVSLPQSPVMPSSPATPETNTSPTQRNETQKPKD